MSLLQVPHIHHNCFHCAHHNLRHASSCRLPSQPLSRTFVSFPRAAALFLYHVKILAVSLLAFFCLVGLLASSRLRSMLPRAVSLFPRAPAVGFPFAAVVSAVKMLLRSYARACRCQPEMHTSLFPTIPDDVPHRYPDIFPTRSPVPSRPEVVLRYPPQHSFNDIAGFETSPRPYLLKYDAPPPPDVIVRWNQSFANKKIYEDFMLPIIVLPRVEQP